MTLSTTRFLTVAAHMLCVAGGVVMTAVMPTGAQAETTGNENEQALSFDSDFLSLGKDEGNKEKHVNLAYFAHKGGMAPGRYPVQVKVNGKLVDEGRLVTFKSWPAQPGKLYACVSAQELLDWWGINASEKADNDEGAVVAENAEPPSQTQDAGVTADTSTSPESCPVGGVVAMVPYAREEFDFNNHLLSLTVPQASLGPASRLRTPPHLWDNGLPAVLMNYTYTGSQQNSRGKKSGSDFLGVNGQLNLLGWRVRSDLSAHRRQGGAAQWNLSRAYAQHDFSRLGGGQLTLGNTASSGGGVDSVSFVGARVESDDGMLDPALNTYTPAITGIAGSPATVTARQYGKVIYQQNVPQGPFSLTDFNRNGSGEVEVEVREADGRVRRFSLAQASNGVLLRQGGLSYSLSAGTATHDDVYVDDRFVQLGGSYGAWANTTLTGGVLLSRDYQALALGTGFYAGAWGAFTYTLKGNRANLSAVPGYQGAAMGVAHDVSWSRSFGATSVGVSYSRGQTPNARSYSEMLSMTPRQPDETLPRSGGNRDSLGVSLSQSLGVWGSLSLNGTRSTTWNSSRVQQNATLGYSTTIKDIGIGIAFGVSTARGRDTNSDVEYDGQSRSRPAADWNNKTDRTMALTVSLPLGKWLGSDRVSSGNYSYTRSNGHASQQAGLSGSALSGALSYSLSQALTDNRTGSVSMGYGGRYGALSGGYSYGAGSNSLSYGASGGLALHPHGATLGKPLALNGGNALVEIPGAAGINVDGASTDWRGYALVSGLTPYDRNRVNVDMTNLPGNMELDASSKNVVPTRGALVSVPFKSNRGFRLLLNLQHQGEPVPFGADVVLKRDDDSLPVTGIVGDAGQVYLSGMPETGTVSARWGESSDERCEAAYALPPGADMSRLATVTATCR